ncbi:hypothetical protein Astex_0314 [Asticcacaulis excentricus CB 48]|uniref:Uncharacterized protein n=1 Tax=Asticcacaulis excentricus (strain ATCC 15261 / DSM 4724 / KCTC 12464 / NCIMB 9791 / VKM B-1370 / CB 48) TaxID=573065 RepID=E8RPN5_ASTEC|nr:hypothetical protein Astex_0314 [Asticcacaulis excentricus CB 48]
MLFKGGCSRCYTLLFNGCLLDQYTMDRSVVTPVF